MVRINSQPIAYGEPGVWFRAAAMKTKGKQHSEVTNRNFIYFFPNNAGKKKNMD